MSFEPTATTRVQANFPKNTSNISSPTEREIAEVEIAEFLSAKLTTPVAEGDSSSINYFDKERGHVNCMNNSICINYYTGSDIKSQFCEIINEA